MLGLKVEVPSTENKTDTCNNGIKKYTQIPILITLPVIGNKRETYNDTKPTQSPGYSLTSAHVLTRSHTHAEEHTHFPLLYTRAVGIASEKQHLLLHLKTI